MRIKKVDQTFWNTSLYTKLSYYMGILAVGIQFFIGFRHLNERFGQLCIFEGMFALAGILFLDLLHGKTIYPQQFKQIDSNLIIRVIFTFAGIAIIQVVFQYVPMTIRDSEYALAVIFCGVSEELFFRGIMLEPFFKAGRKEQTLHLWKDRSISIIEIIGITLSSFLFALFHMNYYGNPQMGFIVLFSGLLFGFCYFLFRDITVTILAHVLLNSVFIIQTFYLINL